MLLIAIAQVAITTYLSFRVFKLTQKDVENPVLTAKKAYQDEKTASILILVENVGKGTLEHLKLKEINIHDPDQGINSFYLEENFSHIDPGGERTIVMPMAKFLTDYGSKSDIPKEMALSFNIDGVSSSCVIYEEDYTEENFMYEEDQSTDR